MKKITLLATALLVVSSLFATPTLKADRLSQKQFMASSLLAVKSTDALSVRKAPQQTAAATYTVTVSEMGAGVGLIKWTASTTTGVQYYAINIYLGDTYVGGDYYTAPYGAGISTYEVLGGYLPAGTYEVDVYACNVVDNKLNPLEVAFADLTLANTATPFTLSDLTITTGDDNKTTIAWKENGTKPENAWLNLYVSSAGTVIYDSETVGKTWITSPVTLDLPAGATYNISLTVLPTNTATYAESFASLAKAYTVGTNPYTPTSLQAVVDEEHGDIVTFSWTATTAAADYSLYIYDEEGTDVLGGTVGGKTTITLKIEPGVYTWSVRALNENRYYISEPVYGAEFETSDTEDPVIDDVKVTTTATTATLAITAHDNYTAAGNLTIGLWGTGDFSGAELGDAVYADGVYTVTIDKYGDDPLKPSTTYSVQIYAVDEAYNGWMSAYMNPYIVEFTTLADTTEGLADLAAAGITYENGIILNANGEQLRVYNAAGQLVAESTRNIDMNTFAAGVYVVNAQQTTFKIAK